MPRTPVCTIISIQKKAFTKDLELSQELGRAVYLNTHIVQLP
jgi:hypothetical protein